MVFSHSTFYRLLLKNNHCVDWWPKFSPFFCNNKDDARCIEQNRLIFIGVNWRKIYSKDLSNRFSHRRNYFKIHSSEVVLTVIQLIVIIFHPFVGHMLTQFLSMPKRKAKRAKREWKSPDFSPRNFILNTFTRSVSLSSSYLNDRQKYAQSSFDGIECLILTSSAMIVLPRLNTFQIFNLMNRYDTTNCVM